ncbi:MAG: SOS response-associated peptidase [Campylobacterota bacterium]|nr:SOS response-associated peptidase [Campylobacterota bacterium]
MPGRLAIYDDISFKKDAIDIFGNIKDNIKVLNKRYNIAPTIDIPILLNNFVYTYAHFGFVPSWAKDTKTININARSESIFEKKTFRESYKSKRAIVPINGSYEWIKNPYKKESIPYIIKHSKQDYLALAAIWDEWYDTSTNTYLLNCALLTTEPNDKIKQIHDRMPVVLDKKDWALWLDNSTNFEQLNKLFKPYPNERIKIEEVSTLVNSVRNDSIKCISKQNVKIGQGSLF